MSESHIMPHTSKKSIQHCNFIPPRGTERSLVQTPSPGGPSLLPFPHRSGLQPTLNDDATTRVGGGWWISASAEVEIGLCPLRPAGGRRAAPLPYYTAAPRRGAGRPRRCGGRRPTATLLSLQVELLPERDLESDGTKISVSGAPSPLFGRLLPNSEPSWPLPASVRESAPLGTLGYEGACRRSPSGRALVEPVSTTRSRQPLPIVLFLDCIYLWILLSLI